MGVGETGGRKTTGDGHTGTRLESRESGNQGVGVGWRGTD